MQGSEERYTLAMRLEHRKGRASNFSFKNRVWHRLYHQTMYDLSISTADFGAVADREGWIMSELKYNHPPGRIWYVPNGASPDFIQPRSFTESPPDRLLYVGTWLDRKGIYYLVDTFTELAAHLPHVTLTVAGCVSSEEHVKADFRVNLRSRVNVLPFLSRDAMADLYASHDIFVFPSLVEGMPLTLLEAMASAMPVVARLKRYGRYRRERFQRPSRAGCGFLRSLCGHSSVIRRSGSAQEIRCSSSGNRSALYLANYC